MNKKTKNDFVLKSIKVHGENKYDYSKVEYINWDVNVCIICPDHGEFWQRPNNHTNGKGCPVCANERRNKIKRSNLKRFKTKSIIVHEDRYDYSKSVYIGCKDLIEIICPEHGEFWQTPSNHMKGEGCPKCRRSKGEIKIEKWLNKEKINYISQKSFEKCFGKRRKLLFDFYLPEYNICVEYDGEQHFKPFNFKNSEKCIKKFNETKNNDMIKNEFCLKNKINLIRISYKDFKNIDKILNEFILK